MSASFPNLLVSLLPRAVGFWRACWCGLLFAGVSLLRDQAEVTKEYQIKAAFLYNFTKFVEWPADHFATADAPIVIGVLGKNPFGDELGNIVQGRKVNGRAIVITAVVSATEVAAVDLVFVAAGEEPRLEGLVAVLHAHGVLTVGESPRFVALGGIINFVLEGDKIRFEIDTAAAERSGLRLSSQLLKLAAVVRRKN